MFNDVVNVLTKGSLSKLRGLSDIYSPLPI
jgi:hypothetical protein